MTTTTLITSREAMRICDVSYRQIDYWSRTGLISPEGAGEGSGSRRGFTFEQLIQLRIIRAMLDAGIRLDAIRAIFDRIREDLPSDMSRANLVIDGDQVAVMSGDQIIDALRSSRGGLVSILPLAWPVADVRASLLEMGWILGEQA